MVLATAALAAVAQGPAPAGERQDELLRLLRQDCGSCHGLTLRGGLGPPLTPDVIAEKSPEALRRTILEGRGGTPMAPWRPFMNEAEAEWLVKRLMQGQTDAP